jgi:hypothetical protein
MPLQVVEAVASSERYTRTHATTTGYTCTPKKAQKALYISIALLYYFFKVHKQKHIKYMLNACGWNRTSQTSKPKRAQIVHP